MKNYKVLIFTASGIVITIGLFVVIVFSVGSSDPVVGSVPTETIITNSQSGTIENTFPYVLLIILSITTLISVSISYYLYKWRKILLTNDNTVVPEVWAKSLIDLRRGMDAFSNVIGGGMTSVINETNANSVKLSSMVETYMELQKALDEKDQEIKRLKSGYDNEIFKRFISRFVRIDQTVDDFITDGGASEALSQIQRLFEDALDECGVSKFVPAIGENYRNATGVADNPKFTVTTNPEEEFLISEVLEAGYHIHTGTGNEVIIPSKVRIYKLG